MEKEFITMQRDTMPIALEYIIKIKSGVDEASEKFQNGKNEEAINLTSYIEEGIQWLIEVATFTKDVQDSNMDEKSMALKLDMLGDAYENEDYTLMGDILEFEIKPILNQWEKVISIVSKN